MLYFIPAWYQQKQWCENEQYWHSRRMHTEFDDTVKHIQLFHRSKAYPFQIMLLSFAPNFRHFLHRQSVYHAPYWSCFDAIQEVRRKKVMVLSFHNLNWPPHIEFVYTPFLVIALLHGEKYAQIEFGEDGNPIQVDMFQNEKIQRRNIYDDRGFVSSTIVYEDEKMLYQDYLTEKGIWKLRSFPDGHVEVNPKAREYLLIHQKEEQIKTFSRLRYESMEAVIGEVLAAYLSLTNHKDLFCVAMHELHTGLLKEALKDKKMILSFFSDRYDVNKHSETMDMIDSADYIITDSRENTWKIENGLGKTLENITDITPFDSRVDFGISQQLSVQKILVPVDGLDDDVFEKVIGQIGRYLLENDNTQVHIFTRQADFGRKERLLDQARQYLKNAGLEEGWVSDMGNDTISENELDEIETIPVRFFVEQCVDELAVSKCMREQRLIIDMRSSAELYLRIAAISGGIPQIVYTENQFVEHEKNGLVWKDINRLPEAIRYYLDSLTNWNEAMVYSYELGKKYTTGVLVEEWKEVIDFVRQDSRITTGA